VTGLTGAVLCIGDELLLGDIVNTNGSWLGSALAAVGVHVVHGATVGDDRERLVTAVRRAMADADVVVLTGGLGPTIDDLTRDALAAVAGVGLTRWPDLEEQLRARYASLDRRMPEAVLRQADVPDGAQPLVNPQGTAPGLRIEVGDRVLYALPGPPHEMTATAQLGVLPELAERTGSRVTTRTLRCAGIAESDGAEQVEAALDALGGVPAGVDLAYLAGSGILRVRFSTDGDPAVLEPLVEAARAALGDVVWGRDEQLQPAVVGGLLQAAGQTVATAESLTGGLVAAALTAVPGSSAYVRGGFVAYATDAKSTVAGVPAEVLAAHGAVSEPTARALAEGARARFGADWGIATTGVAGPDLQDDQPAGTVHLAVAGPDGTRHERWHFPGERDRVRVVTVVQALDLLRRALQDAGPGSS
jgi:nicotinamide-nucleotide amidase